MSTNNSVNTTLSGQTGTGKFVGDTSPTLVTPNIGAANVTSLAFGVNILSTYVSTVAWTPVFTFATPGNLSVSYSTQNGIYAQIGSVVFFDFDLICTPTFTTASGQLQITGLPVTSSASNNAYFVPITGSITYPATHPILYGVANAGTTNLIFGAFGTAVSRTTIAATNFTSTSQIEIIGSGFYFV